MRWAARRALVWHRRRDLGLWPGGDVLFLSVPVLYRPGDHYLLSWARSTSGGHRATVGGFIYLIIKTIYYLHFIITIVKTIEGVLFVYIFKYKIY